MKSIKLYIKQINKNYRTQLILVLILGFFNSLLQGIGILFIIPLIELYAQDTSTSLWVIEFAEKFGSFKDLNFLLVTYFLILTGIALFKGGYTYFSNYVTTRLGAEYAVSSFQSILKANWSFFVKHPPSSLVNLFKTESRVIRVLNMFFFRLLLSGIMIIIQLILAFIISWKLSLVTIFFLGVLGMLQTSFFRKNQLIGNSRVSINEQLQLLIGEVFQGMKFLKLHRLENKKHEEFKNIHFESRDNDLIKIKVDVISDIIFTISGAIVIIGLIYFGLTYKWISISGIVVLLILINRTVNQVKSFIKTISMFFNQLPSFEKFHHLVSEANKYHQPMTFSDKTKKLDKILFKNVHFSYDNEQVISDSSYTFQKGCIYLLFGPSGSGKTTTLDLISGLLSPQSGYISPEASSNLSYVLQDTLLFAGTIRNNIDLGRSYSDSEVMKVIQLTGLKSKIDSLEAGMHTHIKENAINFSGGEKQRLALARALITKPEVLLLDEFTSALDAPTESRLLKNLTQLKENRIIIIVSHRERTKDWVDYVINFP